MDLYEAGLLGYTGFSFRTADHIAVLFKDGADGVVTEVSYTEFKELVITDYEWLKLYGPKCKK